MENKYYAPSIQEFHVGFEYEVCSNKDSSWIVVDDFSNAYDYEDSPLYGVIKDLENNRIRVKCLNREDIESLGWFYKQTTDAGLDYFWDNKTQKHSIICNYTTGWTVITVRSDARKEDYTAFAGYIKNKSELKRLLTQ